MAAMVRSGLIFVVRPNRVGAEPPRKPSMRPQPRSTLPARTSFQVPLVGFGEVEEKRRMWFGVDPVPPWTFVFGKDAVLDGVAQEVP